MVNITYAVALQLLFLLHFLPPASQALGASLEEITHVEGGRPTFRLSDGKTEAIIVPDLGRVMRYGFVGGENLMWNGEENPKGFSNWGGDKTFIGPHSTWNEFAKNLWPPQPEWDGPPHKAEVLEDGSLRTTGQIWPGFEARIIRHYSYAENGELVIEQTIEKTGGQELVFSIWNISQALPPEAVYILRNPNSLSPKGFQWLSKRESPQAVTLLDDMVVVRPVSGASYKIGVDRAIPALASVRDGVAWIQRGDPGEVRYENSGDKTAFSVEIYNHSATGKGHYIELKLLSPLLKFEPGKARMFPIRWSLHRLPGKTAEEAALTDVLKELMK